MFYIIAALFLGVGAVLLIATRQRHPKPAGRHAASAVRTKEATPKPERVKLPRRAKRREPTPERITREEYLRQLAERNAGKPVHRDPR